MPEKKTTFVPGNSQGIVDSEEDEKEWVRQIKD